MENKLLESSAVQNHINILQGIISRMASNSANCKTWAITIISAIVVLLIDKSKTCVLYIAYIPLGIFFLLDSFYLGLERFFRKEYNSFVDSLNEDNFDTNSVYRISGPKKLTNKISQTIGALFSFSTLPFYLIISIAIFVISKIA